MHTSVEAKTALVEILDKIAELGIRLWIQIITTFDFYDIDVRIFVQKTLNRVIEKVLHKMNAKS